MLQSPRVLFQRGPHPSKRIAPPHRGIFAQLPLSKIIAPPRRAIPAPLSLSKKCYALLVLARVVRQIFLLLSGDCAEVPHVPGGIRRPAQVSHPPYSEKQTTRGSTESARPRRPAGCGVVGRPVLPVQSLPSAHSASNQARSAFSAAPRR